MSLFGGARAIWIEPAGDEIAEGVEALLEAPASKARWSPSPARCARRRRCSSWPKPSPLALAMLLCARRPRCRADGDRVGRRFGLKISPDRRGADRRRCGNDQAIVAQELAKLALYLGASPAAPKELDHDASMRSARIRPRAI
jgi:DNA polymerase-3 subunit delta